MNYFELAKDLVRMNEERRQHGYVGEGAIERLPRTYLQTVTDALPLEQQREIQRERIEALEDR